MKATLEFNLPEDKIEWENVVKADDMYAALWDICQDLRVRWKYHEYQTEEEFAIVESIRDKFYEILNDHNISLDK